MITFQSTSLQENILLINEYLQTITGINDDFWEGHVLDSQMYILKNDTITMGIMGIYQNENMTFFYVMPSYIRYAQLAFGAALERFNPKYAFVATNDELFLSLSMYKHKSIELQAYFFREGRIPVRQVEYNRDLLQLAELSDQVDILDKENVEEKIRLCKYYVMRENDVFLGQGFLNKSRLKSDVASIGMSVHPNHRQKGVGRSIIMHMKDICKEKGITPCCGCGYDNENSKRTLESAGFVTKTRLLKVWFVNER